MLVAALLGTGGVGVWVQSGREADTAAQAQTAVNFSVLMTELRENNTQLRADLASLRDRVLDLEAQNRTQAQTIRTLQRYVIQLETAQISLPMPMWVKDRGGVILFANKAYEEEHLTERGFTLDDYVGNRDESVWPDIVADEFRRHDALVLQRGKVWRGFEHIEQPDGSLAPMRIMKWPIMLDGIVVAIGGISWEDFDNEELSDG